MRQFICTLCIFFIASFGLYWHNENRLHLETAHLQYLNEIAQSEATAIERRVHSAFVATHFLAFEVKQNDGASFDFENYAREVINSVGGISSLQLARNGIVSHVYPKAGNELTIGNRLLVDAKSNKEARLALKTKQLTLAGPVETQQGQVTVIGRNPIFIKNNNKDVFWGFASAMITIDDLLVSTKFSQLDQRKYAYQLSRIHPDTQREDVFVRSISNIVEPVITKKINLPNASWTLTLSSANTGWSKQSNYLLNIFLGLLVSFGVSYLFLKPKISKKVVM